MYILQTVVQKLYSFSRNFLFLVLVHFFITYYFLRCWYLRNKKSCCGSRHADNNPLKMHSQNMLEIDPDKLFEERSIAEIEEIQKKIQDEVERKREELRTMVGERYRDLILAADTITAMQVTSTGVINKIRAMEDLCSVFQQRHLLGFQIDQTTHTSIHRNDIAIIAAAAQAKILVTIAEYIWRSLEKNDFLRGAQYFLLARHIKTGVLLEQSGPLAKLRPSLISQYELISQFQSKLINGAEEALISTDISSEVATSCLCVLVLLSGLNAKSLVERFLSLRKSALEKSLSGDEKVKIRVAASLCTLLHTLSLTTICFKESRSGSTGLVWQQLQNLSSQSSSGSLDPNTGAATTSELLDSLPIDPATLRFIPSVVREFRPSSLATAEPLSPEDVNELSSEWLNGINIFLQNELSSVLKLVTSISGVQSVRESALDDNVSSGRCWDSTLKRRPEVWSTYYQPIVTAHVQFLVETQWRNVLTTLRERLADSLRETLRERGSQPENDLRWLVWKERLTDLPQPSQANEKSKQHYGLFLKCRGYSPKVEGLCLILDKALTELLKELSSYTSDEAENERIQLQSHMQEKGAYFLNELWRHIEEDCLNGAVAKDEGSIVLVARFLGALAELCPALQKCFSPVTAEHSPTLKAVGRTIVAWTDVVKMLRTGSEKTWDVWQKLVSARLKRASGEQLLPKLDTVGLVLLHSAPQWDEQYVEEQSESGERLKSLIRVPAQPSFGLQSQLSQACQILGAAQPHTIPSVVRAAFVENLVISILDLYKGATAITNEDGTVSKLPQPQALQLLLDTKFLSALLVPRTHKALSAKVQEVCQLLEQNVDPFDLDVFSPFIQNNVRLSVRRMQCLLGVLVTCWREKYPTMNTAHTGAPSNTSSEQPGVLAVCPPAPWFPLLPGVTRTAALSKPAPSPAVEKGKRPPETRHQKQRSEPIEGLKSGAAAFFGAVSSEWFGSS